MTWRNTQYAAHKGVFIYLNTNASLMTPNKIDLLLKSGFNGSFAISFHAASADVYRNIMGLDMEESKNNVEYLLQRYPKEKIGFSVINYHWPIGEEEKVRALFQQWGMPVHIIKPISRAGLISSKRIIYTKRIAGCAPERVLYQMVISRHGDVLLCCNDMSRKEVIGNLKNTTIQEVWNGPMFERYLQEIYMGRKSSNSMICHFCELIFDSRRHIMGRFPS
jgi:radical SAM protein with 4Fe4S-binding SPASM domain